MENPNEYYEFCCDCTGMFSYNLISGYCINCYQRVLKELMEEEEKMEKKKVVKKGPRKNV